MKPLAEHHRSLLALTLVPGLGPKTIRTLLDRFQTAERVLECSARELAQVPYIGPSTASKLVDAFQQVDVDGELGRVSRLGARILFDDEDDYPSLLREIADPPIVLYCRGELPREDRFVAIVGTRHCTSYGVKTARRLAFDLASAGWTIVSGLARGIDAAAHRGALEAGGRTVAVLAGGLANVYPPEHRELADQIADAGAILTESQTQMEPLAVLFPQRNRIISGISRGVIVVEAGHRSGALLTARHALEQNRDVFAVPGAIDSPASAGVLELLRQGAKMIRHADDVLEDLEGFSSSVSGAGANPTRRSIDPPPDLEGEAMRIWECLGGGPRHFDEICRELQLAPPDLTSLLMTLEIRRVIRRLPGNRYERAE